MHALLLPTFSSYPALLCHEESCHFMSCKFNYSATEALVAEYRTFVFNEMVKVSNVQEMAQSEIKFHSKKKTRLEKLN